MTITEPTPLRSRTPSVSVIVPVHDDASTLVPQLTALRTQVYDGPFEVVVVDNRSTDDSRLIAQGFAREDARIRVVDAPARAGAAHARNAGARAARGDLLLFCDADDVVAPGWLDGLVRGAHRADLVQGRLDVTSLNPLEVQRRHDPHPSNRLPSTSGLAYVVSSNMAVWREVFDGLGGFDEGFAGAAGEDLDLSVRARLAGCSMAFAADAVVRYRYRPRLRDTLRQTYGYAQAEPAVYRRHRRAGVPRRRFRSTVHSWVWLVRHAPDLLSADRRGYWLRRAIAVVGMAVGAVRNRVLYL